MDLVAYEKERLTEAQQAQGEKLLAGAEECGVPGALIEPLINYAVHGIPTGDFLRAFMSNDLAGAVGRADVNNILFFRELHHFVVGYLGSQCHGSAAKVAAWTAQPITLDKVASHG